MTLDKVTAFITRDMPDGRELLVFQHPTAGIQLPAGTVEAGESVENAVLRETREETGLTAVALVKELGSIAQPLEPGERIIVRDTILQASPGDEGTLVKAIMLRRGTGVRVIGSEDNYDQVIVPEYQVHERELIQVSGRKGWVPTKHLTADVQRHFFHLTTTEPTEHHWLQQADEHQFSLFWVPLTQNPGLIPAQDYWYQLVREQLRDTSS